MDIVVGGGSRRAANVPPTARQRKG